MNPAVIQPSNPDPDAGRSGGIRLGSRRDLAEVTAFLNARLARVGLADQVHRTQVGGTDGHGFLFRLRRQCSDELAPEGDILELAKHLRLESATSRQDLETEILVSLLLSPVAFRFVDSLDLASVVRTRANIVESARKTQIDFRTDEADRPAEFWSYDESRGFLLRHGQPLIPAIETALCPTSPGRRYSFSCWRATEYVMLLGIAREAEHSNPGLLRQMTQQAEIRALKGTAFDPAFVESYGSDSQPLPTHFYVPGDRTWFRNPDLESAEVTGFEGSYTFYLGSGCFADFWESGSTPSLRDKCIEIHFWRTATLRNADGTLHLDEELAKRLAAKAAQQPAVLRQILDETLRLQAPPGHAGGGCVERTRDAPRRVTPTACTLDLPDAPFPA